MYNDYNCDIFRYQLEILLQNDANINNLPDTNPHMEGKRQVFSPLQQQSLLRIF